MTTYVNNDQLHFRVSIIVMNQDYFPMIVGYYYLYVVGSADLKWVGMRVFCALAMFFIYMH